MSSTLLLQHWLAPTLFSAPHNPRPCAQVRRVAALSAAVVKAAAELRVRLDTAADGPSGAAALDPVSLRFAAEVGAFTSCPSPGSWPCL